MEYNKIIYGSLLFCAVNCFTSCIDEDLSDCPPLAKDVDILYRIEFSQDVELGFSRDIKSLHLGFWNTPSSLTNEMIFSEDQLPEDMLFRVTLPVDNYSHIAKANCELKDGSHIPFTHNLDEAAVSVPFVLPDTIEAMTYPAYSGTLQMNMNSGTESEHFEILLSTVSSKYEFEVNHPEALKNLRCFISGTKQGYSIWNKLWIDNSKLVTDASVFAENDNAGIQTNFMFYGFPAMAETEASKAVLADDFKWKVYFYSDLNGKTLQHIFTVKQEVSVGRVFNAVFNLTETGGEAVDIDAGVEFDPDWKPGNDFDIEM